MTDNAMTGFLGVNAGSGPKITARFKSKVFSFAHIAVDDNVLTLYQISEPLSGSSSATASNPAPFGTDYQGHPVNDPLPDTVVDPVSRTVLSGAGTGTSALLDKVTVTKPDISDAASLDFSAPKNLKSEDVIDYTLTFRNRSGVALNGAQAVVTLPVGVVFESASTGTATVRGSDVVVSLGRLAGDSPVTLHVYGRVLDSAPKHLDGQAILRSATALPVSGGKATTNTHDRK
jgi:uncharacterized repeat protein (TIGR01451 family)